MRARITKKEAEEAAKGRKGRRKDIHYKQGLHYDVDKTELRKKEFGLATSEFNKRKRFSSNEVS